jgi:hypothetical protein
MPACVGMRVAACVGVVVIVGHGVAFRPWPG